MQCDRRRGPEKSAAVISKISRDPAVAAEASGTHCDCDLGGASEGGYGGGVGGIGAGGGKAISSVEEVEKEVVVDRICLFNRILN